MAIAGTPHPCLTCGACCASFRVSFYWAEGDDGGGTVPAGLTVGISPFLRAMAGTTTHPPRCVALEGVVGREVFCTIHPQRSSTCREFTPSYEDGEPHEPCDRARARHGLAPLRPEDWQGLRPRAA